MTAPVRRTRLIADRYTDSVLLMRLADTLSHASGILAVTAVMATPANKQSLLSQGWSAAELETSGADDIVIAVVATTAEAADAVLGRAPRLLDQGLTPTSVQRAASIQDALAIQPTSNLASISVPGEYAAELARVAIEAGLHVFLFSSNVSIDDEVLLKKSAGERGVLCMGPDCGTAIIAGRGLGFANIIRPGPIGVIGAAGTGIQAVTTLLDRLGVGVSHAIGVGSRDLTDAVGGLTTHAALRALEDDPTIRAIVIVAKPPDPVQAARLRDAAQQAGKPVITCLLGDPSSDTRTLAEAALAAARAVGGAASAFPEPTAPVVRGPHRAGLIRGLFTGGTLAYEANLILAQHGLHVPVATTVMPVCGSHQLIDLGSPELTVGRAHPMIDTRLRAAAIQTAVNDDRVGVVLLDVVLGVNAHPDPAGAVVDAITTATSGRASDHIPMFVAAVVGTDADPQNATGQIARLRDVGVTVAPTTSAAAELAVELSVGGAS